MREGQVVEISIGGMDCAECAQHVQRAIGALPGVQSVNVLLSAEKAIVHLDPGQVQLPALYQAVEDAGYTPSPASKTKTALPGAFHRRVLALFALIVGAVLFVVIVGDWLGVFAQLTGRVPFPVGLIVVIASGWSIFRNVAAAARRRQITSHTLMTVGAIAALAVGQWATAAVVVFFMRLGEYVEKFTTENARRAVKDLAALAPQIARVERGGAEQETPVAGVQVGEIVVVRPGEKIPVDGEVLSGQATVDQSMITGESMPVDAGPGSFVFAASIVQLGSLRVRTLCTGGDATFGRVVKMVEEAEAHRAGVQRLADRFSAWYLPVVVGVAALTLVVSGNTLATAAVLLVACSCSFALATPVAMLASVGAAARRGLLIKGGKYLELLARADVFLIDKTGALTSGKAQITDVVPLNGLTARQLLALAAAAERYSEHPLAEAVRAAARAQGLPPGEPQTFEAVPGMGVHASVEGRLITVGNRRMLPAAAALPIADELERQGKTLLFLARDGELAGVLAAADTLRPEVPAALAALRRLGVQRIEVLTGDHERSAAALAEKLGVHYLANLLPEDKIAVVKRHQAQGHTVVMVGDGVNDAPALAQADVGIAMGAVGSDIAIEVAHIALMREDWRLVPEVVEMARRTMGVVKMNLAFTALYNLVGLTLAAAGLLPPVLAAAAQSLPDLGILANSARLIRQKSISGLPPGSHS